jgi:signal transduction histidine kinase
MYEDRGTLSNRRGEERPVQFRARPIFEGEELVGALEVVEESTPDYEEFPGLASLISHDIRNPLNVLKLEVESIRDDVDESHHDALVHNVERIEEIVDGLSTFVSAAEDGLETERLDVATVATVAWETIDAPAADLETESVTVEADRSLLAELFENLFENAISHGGEDVTVRVGPTAAGFCVEDTGTGIDTTERDRVFEHGYSSDRDGTGFGLPIVHTIASNHGWTPDVTESDEGGARFEFDT